MANKTDLQHTFGRYWLHYTFGRYWLHHTVISQVEDFLWVEQARGRR